MSKVIAKQIDNILKGDKFIRHKKNAKGNTAIYSRNHPKAKFVRVVVDSGIDLSSAKASKSVRVKLIYINRAKSWREITTEIITDARGLASLIKKVEAAEKFVKTCKFCKAKKFKAKTGNTVCANACWAAWSGKKKAATPKKKSSQKITASAVKKAAKNPPRKAVKKSSQKVATKSSQKSSQKIVAEILPGDLVTAEEIDKDIFKRDYTGSILGIIMKVDRWGRVTVNWTANTSDVPEWDLPHTNHYHTDNPRHYRFKVLSRSVEWEPAA